MVLQGDCPPRMDEFMVLIKPASTTAGADSPLKPLTSLTNFNLAFEDPWIVIISDDLVGHTPMMIINPTIPHFHVQDAC